MQPGSGKIWKFIKKVMDNKCKSTNSFNNKAKKIKFKCGCCADDLSFSYSNAG